MEFIQAIAAFILVLAIAGAVVQVIFSYSLQVIAEKNELPEFASFIAWLPLLQLYPYIKVGGGNFKLFALVGIGGTIGVAVLAGVGAAVMGEAGGLVAGLVVAAFAIAAIVYFARIAMGTAERRGLSKWFGLLTFVPIANFFVYPYIAFHDGFRPPNKIGLVLGLLLAFGPLPGQVAMVNQIASQTQEMAETDLGDGVTLEQALGGLGTAMEIGTQLAMLEEMDPTQPEQARMMRDSLAELRTKLDESRTILGEEAAAELETALSRQQQRLTGPPGQPGQASPMQASAPNPVVPAPENFRAPPTLSVRPPLTDGLARNGDRGFAIPISPECPPGTAAQGAVPPNGTREWCEKVGMDAGIKHGWMTEYYENGEPKTAGEYRDGLRVGVWSRFYDDGTLRVQAQFEDGLQHGVLLSWNPDGSLAYEKHFDRGAPASR